MKPKRHSVLTRLERFWFAIGLLIFGIDGFPVAHRPLPKAPSASLKTIRRADNLEDGEAEQFIRHSQGKGKGEKPLSYPLSPSH